MRWRILIFCMLFYHEGHEEYEGLKNKSFDSILYFQGVEVNQ
jgi:hypothetical protein